MNPGFATLRWYAIYTRAHHEKVVAELLCRKGIECFLPLREILSSWADRKKLVQFPLFSGYVFVHTELPPRKLDIMKADSVVRIVGSAGVPEPVPGDQIRALRTLVFHKLELDPYP